MPTTRDFRDPRGRLSCCRSMRVRLARPARDLTIEQTRGLIRGVLVSVHVPQYWVAIHSNSKSRHAPKDPIQFPTTASSFDKNSQTHLRVDEVNEAGASHRTIPASPPEGGQICTQFEHIDMLLGLPTKRTFRFPNPAAGGNADSGPCNRAENET